MASSHRAPKISGRTTTMTMVGVAAGTVALLPSTSQAAPTQSLDQVKAEVTQLNNQAEVNTEQYDGATELYAKLQQKVNGLQAQITQEQAALDTLETSMGMQAAAQYRSGGVSPSLQLVLSASPDRFLSQAGMASQQTAQEAVQLKAINREKAQLALDKKDAADALAAQQSVMAQAAAAKAEVNTLLHQKQAVLNTLTAAQQTAVNSAGGTTAYKGTLPTASGRAGVAVSYAQSKLGHAYVYGATGPNNFDCSGLTMASWAAAGVQIPRTSEEQFAGLPRFYDASQLQPGDLIFMEGNPPGHVAIYVGNGQYIHAPHTGTVVQYGSIDPKASDYGYMTPVGFARP